MTFSDLNGLGSGSHLNTGFCIGLIHPCSQFVIRMQMCLSQRCVLKFAKTWRNYG